MNYAVIGAGNGGKTMAAHLALMGHRVSLYNRTFSNILEIRARGGIDLIGPEDEIGFGQLAVVSSKMSEVIEDAEVIMVVVPSNAHGEIARNMAPHLKDGQTIILNPGRTCGAIEFVKELKDVNCEVDVTVAETETLIYICRSESSTKARIFRIKKTVPLAALPANRTQRVLQLIRRVYPQFVDGVNVLQTGFNNVGAIFHPALTLLNTGWIEATAGNFEFYVEGLTPSVGRILEVLDKERISVASLLGIHARSALEWLKMSYDVEGKDLREAIQNQRGYIGVKAPPTINHRYLFDDVPTGLVPIASFSRHYGNPVPGTESIIQLASILHNKDYWQHGRTLEQLGLSELSAKELNEYVITGKKS
jgi:opine dehydrogenase